MGRFDGWREISEADAKRLGAGRIVSRQTFGVSPSKPSKYRAQKTSVAGQSFDSKKEADRYVELSAMAATGIIGLLACHPKFDLWAYRCGTGDSAQNPVIATKIGEYTADFMYVDAFGNRVVEDVKSKATKTTAYQLRKKLVEACHGITITEV